MSEKPKYVLVIDDDITSLDIVAFLFEERGYTVERCADGSSALESVKTATPDLILVDLLMPNLNGIETVKRFRKMGITDTPIIAFTAVDDAQMHKDARDAGCNEVLTKPLRPDKLLAEIKDYMAV